MPRLGGHLVSTRKILCYWFEIKKKVFMVAMHNDDKLGTYYEVLSSPAFEECFKAMNDEMKSMITKFGSWWIFHYDVRPLKINGSLESSSKWMVPLRDIRLTLWLKATSMFRYYSMSTAWSNFIRCFWLYLH